MNGSVFKDTETLEPDLIEAADQLLAKLASLALPLMPVGSRVLRCTSIAHLGTD
ncbi:MAG TPA: hypothetical protein VFI31_02115 [Pirellulales bacterium]|nr:hypothetical protein [Pirellulales bacterium]